MIAPAVCVMQPLCGPLPSDIRDEKGKEHFQLTIINFVTFFSVTKVGQV